MRRMYSQRHILSIGCLQSAPELMIVSSRTFGHDDVCVYPDSNQILVRALSPDAHVFDRSAVRKYWDGEQTS